MLKQLPVGRLAGCFVKNFGFLPLILELITQLLIIVNRFVSLRRGACIALGRLLFSQLLRLQFSLYLHHLLENSLGSSTIHSVVYAIKWVHKLAGFVEASSRVPREPVKKAEPITPEILGLISNIMGKVVTYLISGLSVCVHLHMPVFSAFPSFCA